MSDNDKSQPPATPDPWAAPDQQPQQPPAPQPPTPGMIPGAQPPASSPGMIAGAQPPAAAYGVPGSPVVPPVEKPTGVATGFLAVTAGYGLVALGLAAFAQSDAESIREIFESGDLTTGTTGPGQTVLSFLSFPLLVASYVFYGMWMSRMRRNRQERGLRTGLGAVEWWGWFVPIASVVLVPMGARRVGGPNVSLGVLLGWWLGWVVAQGLSFAAQFAVFSAIDITSGDLTRPEQLDMYAPYSWAAAAALLVSWGFLYMFVRKATETHADS